MLTDGDPMQRTEGFTLIELLIVVAIMATVAAFAIPNIFGARKSAAECSIIGRMRALYTVSEQYRLRFGVYANNEASLINSGFLGSGSHFTSQGYTMNYTGTSSWWDCTASPNTPGVDGDRHFFVDNSGVIRYEEAGPASSTSQPIGEQ